MPLSPLQNIQREISTHPKEREGFAKSDVENLSPDEIPKAKTLLIHAVSEGALRCNEPLLWLLGTNYEQEISEAYQKGELTDHGSIFLPYVLSKNSRDPIWVEKMKLGIEHGDAAWGMRESALLQLKEISLQVDFVKFCWQLIENDQNNDMKKAAARTMTACSCGACRT